jgi:hypothetical protein
MRSWGGLLLISNLHPHMEAPVQFLQSSLLLVLLEHLPPLLVQLQVLVQVLQHLQRFLDQVERDNAQAVTGLNRTGTTQHGVGHSGLIEVL